MEILRKLRLKKNLSQTTVAKDLGIGQNTYSRYETGVYEPDIEMLKKMAKYFEVPVNVLIDDEDYKNYCNYVFGTNNVISILKEANDLVEQYNSFPEEKRKEYLPVMLEIKQSIDDLIEVQRKYRDLVSDKLDGYKIGIGFTDPIVARRYYEANAQFAPSSSGEDPTDDEIIQLANELYEEQKANEKQ